MLSGTNISMGILESDIPDIFGDAYAVVSTWDPSYYTIDGGNNVTDVANPGQMDDWATVNWASADVVTDADGTKWFEDPLSLIANSESLELSSANNQDLIENNPDGLVMITSLRAKADQLSTGSAFFNGGWSGRFGSALNILWRFLQSNDGTSFRSDMDFYIQASTGLLPSPYDATQMQIGPIADDPAFPQTGVYDPDGNVFTTPAYVTDDDMVIAVFLQPTGIRMSINNTFCTLYNETYMNSDGTVADAGTMAAVMALNWTPYQLNINGTPNSSSTIVPNLGAATKTDYMGLFPGSFSDARIAAIVSRILTNKPT